MFRMGERIVAAGRRWQRHEHGATAVEFALIAAVFLWVLVGLVELGMLMLLNNGLEDGVDRAARLLRTGQTQRLNIDVSKFRSHICNQVLLKDSCMRKLIVDVRAYPDFGSIPDLSKPKRDRNGNLNLRAQYVKGAPRQVLLVRAYYDWKFFTPMIGRLMSNDGSNAFLLSVATTFRTEPYSK